MALVAAIIPTVSSVCTVLLTLREISPYSGLPGIIYLYVSILAAKSNVINFHDLCFDREQVV